VAAAALHAVMQEYVFMVGALAAAKHDKIMPRLRSWSIFKHDKDVKQKKALFATAGSN
jgi:hypothetical protein